MNKTIGIVFPNQLFRDSELIDRDIKFYRIGISLLSAIFVSQTKISVSSIYNEILSGLFV